MRRMRNPSSCASPKPAAASVSAGGVKAAAAPMNSRRVKEAAKELHVGRTTLLTAICPVHEQTFFCIPIRGTDFTNGWLRLRHVAHVNQTTIRRKNRSQFNPEEVQLRRITFQIALVGELHEPALFALCTAAPWPATSQRTPAVPIRTSRHSRILRIRKLIGGDKRRSRVCDFKYLLGDFLKFRDVRLFVGQRRIQ